MVIQKKKTQWTVSEEFHNQRLDYWLKKKISYISYPILCKLIRKGVVRVNGKRVKNFSILNSGDSIKFSRNINEDLNTDNDNKKKYNLKFAKYINSLVAYKDEYSIVLNKPSGLAVQGGTNVKLNVDIMLDSLKFNLQERPKLVHRIDKQTSGLLLIARTLQSSKYYGELFKKHKIDKLYLSIVNGCPKYKKGKIMLSIGKDKKLASLTYFKVLGYKNGLSLLVLNPITGRKHQIREHLNSIGNQICGETKFKNNVNFKLNTKFFYLHAYSLKFIEQNGKLKQIYAPLPEYFEMMIKKYDFINNLTNKQLEFKNLEDYKLIG